MYIHTHSLINSYWFDEWVPVTCSLTKFEKENSYTYVWGNEYMGAIAIARSFLEHISKNSVIIELADVYVHTPFRNKGNGFMFLKRVIDKIYQTYSQSFPNKTILIYLQVHKFNYQAEKLYNKLNFKLIEDINKFPKSIHDNLTDSSEVNYMCHTQ